VRQPLPTYSKRLTGALLRLFSPQYSIQILAGEPYIADKARAIQDAHRTERKKMMNFKSTLRTIPAATLLGVALFSSPRSMMAAPSQEHFHTESAVNIDLKDLRSLAGQLNRDADQLNSLMISGLHWETHAFHLNRVRDQVNLIGDRLAALREMRSLAAPWQQDAIDSIVPVAVEIADRTTAAITHLNENHQYLWAPQYIDHLRTIMARSDEMHGLLDNHVKIIEARDKIRTLQDKLAERG
jgi:hypothetical protein